MAVRYKFAFAFGGLQGDPKAVIDDKLLHDMSLTFSQRAELSRMISGLPAPRITELSNILAGVAGAGVGALIAKYLLGLGFVGSTLMAILGMNVANSLTPQTVKAFNPMENTGFYNYTSSI